MTEHKQLKEIISKMDTLIKRKDFLINQKAQKLYEDLGKNIINLCRR
jgi:hypothetical protein